MRRRFGRRRQMLCCVPVWPRRPRCHALRRLSRPFQQSPGHPSGSYATLAADAGGSLSISSNSRTAMPGWRTMLTGCDLAGSRSITTAAKRGTMGFDHHPSPASFSISVNHLSSAREQGRLSSFQIRMFGRSEAIMARKRSSALGPWCSLQRIRGLLFHC